jgi:hypothetical protein
MHLEDIMRAVCARSDPICSITLIDHTRAWPRAAQGITDSARL